MTDEGLPQLAYVLPPIWAMSRQPAQRWEKDSFWAVFRKAKTQDHTQEHRKSLGMVRDISRRYGTAPDQTGGGDLLEMASAALLKSAKTEFGAILKIGTFPHVLRATWDGFSAHLSSSSRHPAPT